MSAEATLVERVTVTVASDTDTALISRLLPSTLTVKADLFGVAVPSRASLKLRVSVASSDRGGRKFGGRGFLGCTGCDVGRIALGAVPGGKNAGGVFAAVGEAVDDV